MLGWIDARAGASGDMFLGALCDLGVPLHVLQDPVDSLGLGIDMTPTVCERAGLGAVKMKVAAPRAEHHRTLSDIRRLLEPVSAPVREIADEAFCRLAQAESAVHRFSLEDVHFHEVGALDAIADILATAAGFHHLGLTAVHCSRVGLGSGNTRGAHGPLPVPVPAVLHLLAGAPVSSGPAPMECTTPTGAALLATLVSRWDDMPDMTVDRVGHGAGDKDPTEAANLLRLVVGEPEHRPARPVLIEANIDDLDPRLWPHVIELLLDAGAHDAWLTPIIMKKGRPAHTLAVLCPAGLADRIRAAIFRETSTIGVREVDVRKHHLELGHSTIHVDGQPIRIKTASLSGEPVNRNPEWTDVLAASQQLGVPARHILDTARRVAAGQT